jgi:CubicO group peptidase (beta-lactamase class C family)
VQQLLPLLILLLFTALGSDARRRAADRPDEPSAAIVRGDLGRRLDALFAGSDKDRIDGAVLVARGGQVLLRKGYGLADPKGRNPVRHDTVFCIASNTKPFTATSILRLE